MHRRLTESQRQLAEPEERQRTLPSVAMTDRGVRDSGRPREDGLRESLRRWEEYNRRIRAAAVETEHKSENMGCVEKLQRFLRAVTPGI
jgi:hypothetical protein